jgi:hypothetical protein
MRVITMDERLGKGTVDGIMGVRRNGHHGDIVVFPTGVMNVPMKYKTESVVNLNVHKSRFCICGVADIKWRLGGKGFKGQEGGRVRGPA